MTNLPDPQKFEDPLKYLRECHRLIVKKVAELSGLIAEAEARGVRNCFREHPEWSDVLQFFTISTAKHEDDEEVALFPVLLESMQRIGFQPPESPIRFLKEGHQVLQERARSMTKTWQDFIDDQDQTPDDEAQFLAAAKEMVSLYKDHVELEEERIYKLANEDLSPADRFRIMAAIRENHDASVGMPMPSFSDPKAAGGAHEVRYINRRNR